VGRSVWHWVCVCAVGVGPLTGCGETAGTGGGGISGSAGAAGAGGAGGSRIEVTVEQIFVTPEDTDPAIDDSIGGDHLIYVPSVSSRPELFVYLVGTDTIPFTDSLMLEVVAEHMKVIAPQYVNAPGISTICIPDPDPDCYEKMRLEGIYGTDDSPHADVSMTNSIVHRVVKLLEWLDAEQPAVGWSDYLEAGQPRWDRIALAGHSRGAGMAALIARDHEVERVLMLGGTADFRSPFMGEPADWITDPKVTPIERHFGFAHVNDTPLIEVAWDAMELPGPPAIVDDSAPPYSGSHYLQTNVDVPPTAAHRSVVSPMFEPDGSPTFKDTWLYMCCSELP
jgi:hypothetical protein